MHVSLQVMSDFADSMQAIASRSKIVPASIQAEVFSHEHLCHVEHDRDAYEDWVETTTQIWCSRSYIRFLPKAFT